MTQRGEIILVSFPFSDGSGAKVRPSLVVQNDRDNRRLQNTVVAMITGNTVHAHEPTQVLIDPATSDGRGSGLRGPSAVKCSVLSTVNQRTIRGTLGAASPALMRLVDDALKAALDLH